MRYVILIAALLAFVLPTLVLRWTDPRRQERKRARRALQDDKRWQRFPWPE